MIKEILTYPDKRLSIKAEEVDINEYPKFDMDLLDTLQHNGGLGLAAPQIGVSKRIILYRDYAKEFKILINPKIISHKGATTSRNEGCLSVPNFRANVNRSKVIKIEAYNEYGNKIRIKANGMEAIILQHEIDHLDGILFIDKSMIECDGCHKSFHPGELSESICGSGNVWKKDGRIALQCNECYDHWIGHC